jgi:signal transduction histidine kinase
MSRTTKLFIAAVAAVGLLATALTLIHAEWRSAQTLQFILYVVLAVLSSRMKVGLPGVTGTLSVNFVFILLSAVELPRVDTLLISCTATLAQCLWFTKARPGLIKISFNLGNAALCGVVCSMVYGSPAIRTINSSLPVLLFCASVSYFLLNTVIVAEIIALTEMKRTVQVWRENFLWTAPQYIFGAGLVGVIHICNRHFGWEYAILVFPGIYLLDRSYRVYLSRLQEEKDHVRDKDEAYAQLAEAQQGLVALSRQAGMAEVASGVLHNVGNVLNSVNVSATLVANKIRESRITNLVALSDLLNEHAADLPNFLSSDPKGQRVLPYLAKLATCLREEHQMMLQEVESLTRHIDHIKEIVAAQQNYGKVFGLIEAVSLPDLVEDAIAIVEPALRRKGIHLERDYEALPPVAVDKHQVLQILLNLLRNAEDAIDEAGKPEKLIHVRINLSGDDRVRIEVRDNGVGLASENLTRIFAHGFTTKPHGHGFGLHSGALAAGQMGGTLSAESDGPGQGAVFTLELPLAATKISPATGVPSDRRLGDKPQADGTGGEVTAQPYERTAAGRYQVPSPPQTTALSSAPSAGA